MKRRQFLGGLAVITACSGIAPRTALADAGAPPLAMLVGGPDGGQTSRWGNACALAMSPLFPGSPNILTQAVGGLDGVSGANQFDALVVPDGKTAAILPGAALIAYLTGDPRVHFDPTRWAPVLAGMNSGVLMLRGNPAPSLASLVAGPPLRIAADQPQSNDLAALLALARLGIGTAPVFGLRGTEVKTSAFINGEVDAVFLCGEGVPEDMAPLTAAGAAPFFCLGAPGPDGSMGPDPLFPGLADAISLGTARNHALDAACKAAITASVLDFLLVLPHLADPSAASQWVQAASNARTAEALAAAASASAISLQPAPALAACLATLALPPAAQASLHDYMARNFAWAPG